MWFNFNCIASHYYNYSTCINMMTDDTGLFAQGLVD